MKLFDSIALKHCLNRQYPTTEIFVESKIRKGGDKVFVFVTTGSLPFSLLLSIRTARLEPTISKNGARIGLMLDQWEKWCKINNKGIAEVQAEPVNAPDNDRWKRDIIEVFKGKENLSQINGETYIQTIEGLVPLKSLSEKELQNRFDNAKSWTNDFIDDHNFRYEQFLDTEPLKDSLKLFLKLKPLLEAKGEYQPKVKEFNITIELKPLSQEPLDRQLKKITGEGYHTGDYSKMQSNIDTNTGEVIHKKTGIRFRFPLSETAPQPAIPEATYEEVVPKSPISKLHTPNSPHSLNKAIEAFIDSKGNATYTSEEIEYVNKYTGSGGLIKEGATGPGVLHEFYTPDLIVEKMWSMVYQYGFSGGKILEPAAATGRFLKHAPHEAEQVTAYEINKYAAKILSLLYPKATIIDKPFETIFFQGNVRKGFQPSMAVYDLVIGNPPYHAFESKHAGMGEAKATGITQYDQYFMYRGLQLLKPGGLLCFIIPSSFLRNNYLYNDAKKMIADLADLVKAYRLPNGVFDRTDTGTDIVLFRKK